MTLLVQEFLKNKSFQQLQEEHGVYATFSKSGHKFSLNYDMIEAKESDLLAQECRGLILSTGAVINGTVDAKGKVSRNHIILGDTHILAFPMKRFFNAGQGAAANVNWSDKNLRVLEKLDGTLCIVYFDKHTDAWCVATRSVPEADILLDNGLYTFRTLFEKAVKETAGISFDEFTTKLIKDNTYCFELTTPLNTIVVKYSEYKITLLTYRNNITGKEAESIYADLIATHLNIPSVKQYNLNYLEDVVNWVSSLNPLEHEGVVVLDSNFNRIKVKNANYVAFSKARDTLGASERNCLELILNEKDDDVINALPQEIVDNIVNLKSKVVRLLKDYDNYYLSVLEKANSILSNDKKTFAVTLQQRSDLWQAPFFYIYAGKAKNMREFISKSKKEGTWPNSFLDNILNICKNYNDNNDI